MKYKFREILELLCKARMIVNYSLLCDISQGANDGGHEPNRNKVDRFNHGGVACGQLLMFLDSHSPNLTPWTVLIACMHNSTDWTAWPLSICLSVPSRVLWVGAGTPSSLIGCVCVRSVSSHARPRLRRRCQLLEKKFIN